VVKLLTELRAKHASDKKNFTWGVDGMEGVAADMNVLGIWEPLAAKSQTIKTAIESGKCPKKKMSVVFVAALWVSR
jgi:T-complex protein 1 subunit gamma